MTTSTMKQCNSTPFDWTAMPVVLTVEEMRAVLGIGESKAYRLMAEPGFPKVKIGNMYKVYRDGLRRYLENQIEMKR